MARPIGSAKRAPDTLPTQEEEILGIAQKMQKGTQQLTAGVEGLGRQIALMEARKR